MNRLNWLASNERADCASRMVQCGPHRAQTRFNIPEALAATELRERQSKKPVPTGEAPHTMLALVTLDDLTELSSGNEVHQLRKDSSPRYMPSSLKKRQSRIRIPRPRYDKVQVDCKAKHRATPRCQSTYSHRQNPQAGTNDNKQRDQHTSKTSQEVQ